uniref:Uncharacterized protein n=1 Tax=Glossina pallidipes TaxID=7398 RepID=A0A1A9ZCY9_GLOPL
MEKVITGGSDGIGKGYAKELAKRGLNVVIISHMREELIATAKEIENLYKTEVKWIVADFSKGKEVYEHIKEELLDIPIGILVNNVGYAASPDKFYNRSEDFLWNIININVGAVTLMSRIVIPQMKKQGKGAIVNIASGLALQPTPLWAVYAATKSYVRSLSLAMERELFEYNVTVQCVIPSFVLTKLIQFSELLSRGFFSSMWALYEILSSVINLVGLLAATCFLYDNFKSLFSILKAVLEPYFRPHLPHSLPDRFGKWAENLYKTEVKWIVADFSKGKEVYEHIKKELLDIPIGILVNNVGCASCPDELCNRSEDWLWNIINLNVGAVTLMSRIVIPQMKKQGKGAIVNISSNAELTPIPLTAVYSATKRYVRSLSLAMGRELFKYNITVQCVTPSFVRTELLHFSDILARNKFVGTPVETYTRAAVFTLGKTQETTGYWTHALLT